jgi:signal transduction histidine kinase/class 3 adenylate cyclase/ActR/RegA family two-component response regulator
MFITASLIVLLSASPLLAGDNFTLFDTGCGEGVSPSGVMDARSTWNEVPDDRPHFGDYNKPVWYAVEITERLTGDAVMSLKTPSQLGFFEWYRVTGKGPRMLESYHDYEFVLNRKTAYRAPAFLIPEGAGQGEIFLLRITPENRGTPELQIQPIREFERSYRIEAAVLAILFGAVALLALYNLILFLVIRDRNFLFFFIYAFIYLLYLFDLAGLTQVVLPFSDLWFFRSRVFSPFFGGLSMAAATLFVANYFKPAKRFTLFKPVLWMLLAGSLALSVLALLPLPYRAAYTFGNIQGIVLALSFLGMAVWFLVNGYRAAIPFLAAHVMVLLGTILYSLTALGLIPDNPLTRQLNLAGPALQMLLLSVAIAGRWNSLALQKERIQQASIEALKKAEKTKDLFLANTSHELLTPLNGIIGLTEVIRIGSSGPITPDMERNLSLIIKIGKDMTALVHDLLDFSRMKDRKLKFRISAVDLSVLAGHVVTVLQKQKNFPDIILSADIPEGLPPVLADEVRLRQILGNLVSNALKFTDTGEVRISAREKNGKVEISVRDTGIGIPEEKLETIFKAFEQLDSGDVKKYRGLGLGLAIARQLIEQQGGTIHAESVPGQGSLFTFTLPAAKGIEAEDNSSSLIVGINESEEPEELLPLDTPANEGEMTVLIVDDDAVNRKVLTEYLAEKKLGIRTATSGEQALEMIKAGKPDMVLMDVMLPGMTGYDCVRQIRELHSLTELPVIIVTARHHPKDHVEGFASGANDYLAKPFTQDELFARLGIYLQMASAGRSFMRFIPGEFLKIMGKENLSDIQPGDHRMHEMSILFADIRSFTTLSESMTADETFKFLNSYLSRVVPLIRAEGGFVDKYIGDGIMALFPRSGEDAVRAAIAMQKEIIDYNLGRGRAGYIPIRTSIGIHSGNLMLGTVGDARRLENTVISDAVNTASRMEGIAKRFDAPILISQSTLLELEDPNSWHYRFLGKIRAKGKKDSVAMFEFLDGADPVIIELRRKTHTNFEQGVIAYNSRDFEGAAGHFEKVIRLDAKDKAARYYYQACLQFKGKEVPPGWDGALEMKL